MVDLVAKVGFTEAMSDTNDLIEPNAEFAAARFVAGLSINPSGNMMVVGCVDPASHRPTYSGSGWGKPP